MVMLSIRPRALSWVLSALVFGIAFEAFATEPPHIALDIIYDEQARRVHIEAKTTLSESASRFYLSKASTIETLDPAPGITIKESYDAHVFSLRNGEQEATIRLTYSLSLPRPNQLGSSAESSGRIDWSGTSTNAFLPGSRLWYPFFNQPSTVRLRVKTVAELRAIAPGLPITHMEEDGYAVSIFDMSKPILGVDLMIGHWLVQQKVMTGMEEKILLQTYFNEENADIAKEYLDLCERYILFYEKLIGPYPYSSFTVVSSPHPAGLGMPSLTYISEKILKYPFIKNQSLPHEIVHNWWGNGVRVDYELGNWSEGLTTYMADYWQVALTSENAAKEMRYGWLRNYASISDEDEESLQAFTSRHHTASSTIGYGKAAMVFQMLRNTIGNKPFINCLREFWLEYQYKSASFHDIRDTCQNHTNSDLTLFFDTWISTVDAPTLDTNLTQSSPTNHQLTVNQNGNWAYPLELEISGDSNKIKLTKMIRGEETTFVIPIGATKSTEIKLDPNFNVWRHLYATELVGTIRDFIAAKKPIYIQLTSNIQNSADIISTYFLEDMIQNKYGPNFTNPKKQPTIIVADITNITEHLNTSDNANEINHLMPLSGTDLVMASTYIGGTATLLIGISESISAKDLSILISRARHYGRYSWLKVVKSGRTEKGKWSIREKIFSY